MRNGFHVYDTDTHVMPIAEVLEPYVDPAFRARLPELAAYRMPVEASTDDAAQLHQYRIKRRYYRRVLGDADPHPTFTGRSGRWRGSKEPRPGIQDDQAENRVKDMDDEGTDVHFLVPSSWTGSVGLEDPAFEVGFARAYHRHMADFCGQYPDRLKSMIVASTRCVDDAVREIHQWGTSKWAVAVMLLQNLPVDHPNLQPIWKAAQDYDLAVVHHSSTWNPPYFPGYRDLWDNIFLGRMASHPWGAMRFVAAFIGAGIMDRYPDLRVGTLECGFGWLPFWGRRMNEQATYVGGVAPLKHAPSDYLISGRFFCSIEMHEGEDMFNSVTAFLGDDVLMYASDYPHPECHFPESVDQVLSWPSLQPDTQRKLLWDNAVRFYKQT
ncbi:MAG: amidohydrolase family protein [bacterium]|nr:amidohydrolase family protein [bacterium]